jgi:hypothetical protein
MASFVQSGSMYLTQLRDQLGSAGIKRDQAPISYVDFFGLRGFIFGQPLDGFFT